MKIQPSPTKAPEEDAPPPRPWRPLRETLLVLLLLTAMAAVPLGPALADCDSTIFGGPGDSTAGGVWRAWQYEALGSGPWPERTDFINYPHGEPMWSPHFITAQVLFIYMWAVAQVASPVCTWNIAILTGLLGSGLAMYHFTSWLTKNPHASAFAAIAYTFSGYRMNKATGHVAYVHSYVLVFVLWAAIALVRRPDWKRAALLGASLGLAAYTDGYYILLAFVGAAALLLACLIHAAVTEGRNRAARVFAFGALAGLIAAVLLIPQVVLYKSGQEELATSVIRNKDELQTYSARLHEYLLPPRSHPLFSHAFGEFQDRHLHNSNYSEQTLFLGWTVIVLASITLAGLLRKGPARKEGRTIIIGLGAAGAAAIWFSAPPSFDLLRIWLPGPSDWIFDFAPFWRVYARFFLVAHTALVALAAMAVAGMWAGQPRMQKRTVLAACLAGLAIFEQATGPRFQYWSYDADVPAVYDWLAGRPDEVLAEYPLHSPPLDSAYAYLTYQVHHRKKLINGSQHGSRHQMLREGILGLGDPQTVPGLRGLGATVVLLHHDHPMFREFRTPPPGLEPIAAFKTAAAYRIEPGPVPPAIVGIGEGFHPAEYREWNMFRWMISNGSLEIFPLNGDSPREMIVAFEAISYKRPRMLEVSQEGNVLFEGEVGTEFRPVRFAAGTRGGPIRLSTRPAEEPGPQHDPRPFSFGITQLSVEQHP